MAARSPKQKLASLTGSSRQRPTPAAKLALTGARQGWTVHVAAIASECTEEATERDHGARDAHRPPTRVVVLLCGHGIQGQQIGGDDEELRHLPFRANLAELSGRRPASAAELALAGARWGWVTNISQEASPATEVEEDGQNRPAGDQR
jgi:hypothetical protein